MGRLDLILGAMAAHADPGLQVGLCVLVHRVGLPARCVVLSVCGRVKVAWSMMRGIEWRAFTFPSQVCLGPTPVVPPPMFPVTGGSAEGPCKPEPP